MRWVRWARAALTALLLGSSGSLWVHPAQATEAEAASVQYAAEAEAAASGKTGDERVRSALRRLDGIARREGLRMTYAVTPLASGQLIAGHGQNEDSDPASNTKLATAAYALHELGPDFRFKTEVHADHAGNLYVRGGFDPTLGPSELEQIARAIKTTYGGKITGDVILDGTRLKEDGRTPVGFSPNQRWVYLTPPAALAVDKDLYSIMVKPGKAPGEPTTFEADLRTYRVKNDVVTGPRGQKSHIAIEVLDSDDPSDARKSQVVRISGTINPEDWGRKLVMRSPDPITTFRNRLSQALRGQGVRVRGTIHAGITPDAGTFHVYTHESAPLTDILKSSLGSSNEFDHEMFAVAVASYRRRGASVSVADGVDGLRRFVNDEVRVRSFVLRNASGIGGVNRLSNRDITKIVRWAARDRNAAALLDDMARPGQAGTTVAKRMLGTEATEEAHVKTGTNGQHILVSGVIRQREKEPEAGDADVAFSVRVSGEPAKRTTARAIADSATILLSNVEVSGRKPPVAKAPPVLIPRH